MSDTNPQNVLYTNFLQPAFKFPSFAISHTFQFPRVRSKAAEEPVDALQNPFEIVNSIHDFIRELD